MATTPISNTQLLYNWTKDGFPLSVGGRLSYPTPGGAGWSITISPVQSSDAGLYQCTVYTQLVNSFFPPIALPTAACLLTVSGKPHTHTHIHTHTHTCTCTCTHTHIYKHNTIHMQTHIHIHILILLSIPLPSKSVGQRGHCPMGASCPLTPSPWRRWPLWCPSCGTTSRWWPYKMVAPQWGTRCLP